MTDGRDGDSATGYVGRSVDRVENPEILTGDAEYIHDLTPPECVHMALVRSPYPHADIVGVDVDRARDHPECLLVMTGADVARDFSTMPGRLGFREWVLARDRVRFVGEPVALVVATDRYVAEDIASLVTVEYEPRDHVVDVESAARDEVLLHEERGTNRIDADALEFGPVDAAFEDADQVVTGTYRWGRISGVPLETAGVVADYDPEGDQFYIDCNLQLYAFNTELVHEPLGYPRERVHVRVPNHIGGSFGTKIAAGARYCALAGMASYHLERPVKFVEDRIEYLQGGDAHSCEREYTVAVAVDDDGTIRGLDVEFADDLGAVPRYPLPQALKPLSVASTAYEIEAIRYAYELYVTNKVPQTAYRGFGVQQHTFALEMIIEEAAEAVDMDPSELRHRNLIPPDAMPYTLPTKNVYDSGDYPAALERMEALVDERERRPGGLLDPDTVAARRAAGKYRGTRPVVTLEPSGGVIDYATRFEMDDAELEAFGREDVGGFPEHLTARLETDGTIQVELATSSAGQGHRTVIAQLLADELGVAPETIAVGTADSAESPVNFGSAASRMGIMLAGVTAMLATEIRDAAVERAGTTWDVDPSSVTYEDGYVVHGGAAGDGDRDSGGDDRIALTDVASSLGTAFSVEANYENPALDDPAFDAALEAKLPTYPATAFSVDAPIVEVDIETGEVDILTYYSLHDCGTVLNPSIVDGQVQGAIAHGIGAALLEEFEYDEHGQPQSVTLFEYLLPSIDVVPSMELHHQETPSPVTPRGVKGAGEGGVIAAAATIPASINAALEPLGVRVDTVPIRPDRLRNLIRREGDGDQDRGAGK